MGDDGTKNHCFLSHRLGSLEERCMECHQRKKESGLSQFGDKIGRERGESHTSVSVIDVLFLNSSPLITGEQVTRLFPAWHLY